MHGLELDVLGATTMGFFMANTFPHCRCCFFFWQVFGSSGFRLIATSPPRWCCFDPSQAHPPIVTGGASQQELKLRFVDYYYDEGDCSDIDSQPCHMATTKARANPVKTKSRQRNHPIKNTAVSTEQVLGMIGALAMPVDAWRQFPGPSTSRPQARSLQPPSSGQERA